MRRVRIKRKSPNPRPATIHLNEHVCIQLIGATLGSLASMTDIETLRGAIRWCAETDKAWLPFKRLNQKRMPRE
jgi:hypothetical protein